MAKKDYSHWAMAAFGLPFAAIAAGMLTLSIIPTLYNGWRVLGWVEVPAEVMFADLARQRSDDTTTYKALGRYRYQYTGRTYYGQQIGWSDSYDNSTWHPDTASDLRYAKRNGQPISIWVNPDNPAESVYRREIRWASIGIKMIFIGVFGLVGFGLIFWAIKSGPLHTGHPEAETKPWLGEKLWASATIYSNAKTGLYVAWIFAFIWNAISSPILFVLPKELNQGNYAALLGLLFPLIGLGLVIWAIKKTRSWLRFGRVPLQLDPYPGSIGGQVGGNIDVNIPYRRDLKVAVTLSCLYSTVRRTGKNSKRVESLIWQREGYTRVQPSNKGSKFSFCFDVPADQPASSSQAERSYYLWRVDVKCSLEGADFDRQYEIPVFKTGQKSRLLQTEESSTHPEAERTREANIERVMQLTQIADGVELFFPKFRNTGNQVASLIVGLVFAAIGIGTGFGDVPLIFPIAFSAIGFALLGGGIYGLFNTLHVQLTRRGISSYRTLFGVVINRQTVRFDQVKRLRLHESASTESGNQHTTFYTIKAELHGGKSITVAESLSGKQTAHKALETIAMLSGYRAR